METERVVFLSEREESKSREGNEKKNKKTHVLFPLDDEERICGGKPSEARSGAAQVFAWVCLCERWEKTSRVSMKKKVIFIQQLHTYFKFTYLHILYNDYNSCV